MRGVKLWLYGEKQDDGSYKSKDNNVPHVARFFYIWNYLKSTEENYRYVIVTDTRDVIFQTNPSDWLQPYNIHDSPVVLATEGLQYKNEPWGYQNLKDAFGPYFQQYMANEHIYNVGVIAGYHKYIRDLMLMIFQMSINRPVPVVDQAAFNFLMKHYPYNDVSWAPNHDNAWAVQLGTSIHAIESGKGDLGLNMTTDKLGEYKNNYQEKQPKLWHMDSGDVYVLNDDRVKFVVVHQYDRVNGLKEKIEKMYGDTNE